MIKVLILDVDGVLTTGGIQYGSDATEYKTFHVRDGSGIKYWFRAGHQAAILSGRSSPVVTRRAEELGIQQVFLGAKDKLPHLVSICDAFDVSPNECAYMGDDLPDIPVMREVGVPIAVQDAVPEVKEIAVGVTQRCGGCGAVREAIEAMLQLQGRWGAILSRYVPDAEAE